MPKVKLTKSEQVALNAIENLEERKTERRAMLKAKRDAIDLSKYVKGTALYAKMAQMKYSLPSVKEIRIKEQKKFAQGIKSLDNENPIEYFTKFVEAVNQKNINIINAEVRQKQITSGEWVENKEVRFKENYIKALEALSMDKDIINRVKKLDSDEIRFMMPEITMFYVPNEKHRIKNKRSYHLDADLIASDSLKATIQEKLAILEGDEDEE